MNPADTLSYIVGRRSLRAMEPGAKIPQEAVSRMLEAARWAPSCSNTQPWRFVVVQEPEAFQKALQALKPGNRTWAQHAGALIVLCANPADDYEMAGQPAYLFDCGLAAQNLMLQGVAEGLVMHPMAGWEEEPMRLAIGLPMPYRVVCVIAAGQTGKLENLPEDLQKREAGERVRKPLANLVYFDAWPNEG